MSGLRTAFLAALCVSLIAESILAQPRGEASDRDRGLLGRLGARREERLSRNAPEPPAANQAAAQGRPNVQANPALGARPNPAAPFTNPAANPALRGRSPAQTAAARASAAANAQATNRAPGSQPGSQRSSYYPPTANPTSRNATQIPGGPTGNPSLAPNLVPPPPGVQSASATAPANRLPYNGPGVLIRLPRTISGEVNYLVDDNEHLIVHSGDVQLLRLKGSYEVRFSRGVTNEGRSYGEARYTITEGVYRFDVSDNGWELYREGEARDVEPAVADAQKRADEARREDTAFAGNPNSRSDSTTSLPPPLAPRDTQLSDRFSLERAPSQEDKPAALPPSPALPSSEETLPAPKSILDPS